MVRRHVEGRESYRVIAKNVYQRSGRKISPTSLQKMVEELGRRCKTALEMSKELKPSWDGVLLVDEKMCAKDEARASELFQRLQRTRRPPRTAHRKAIAFLKRHWNRLMQHHRVQGLPRTTNLVENVNKQLERRFKTIEAFQHRHTAVVYVNLLVAYLRQKPYTDCRGKRRKLNGHSRLHAAGVRLTQGNWLKAALKSDQNSNR